jgi:hypothetical protein
VQVAGDLFSALPASKPSPSIESAYTGGDFREFAAGDEVSTRGCCHGYAIRNVKLTRRTCATR